MQQDHDKALRLLGLARRAGKVALGHNAVEQAARSGGATLIVVARDASSRTKRSFRELGAKRRVPVITEWDKVTLGTALGASAKAVCAVCDDNIARGIGEVLKLQEFEELESN